MAGGMLDAQKQTITIDGAKYTVTPLGALVGMRMLARITRIVGGSLADVVSLKAAAAAIGTALAGFAERLTEEDVVYLCDTFMESTQLEAEPGKVVPLKGVFNTHFAGRYVELFEWLKFCAEVNFGPLAKALKAAKAQPSAPAAPAAPAAG